MIITKRNNGKLTISIDRVHLITYNVLNFLFYKFPYLSSGFFLPHEIVLASFHFFNWVKKNLLPC